MALDLFNELGIKFQRNLEQSRTKGHADLIADDPDFPCSLELKRRQTGNGVPLGAWGQAMASSDTASGKHAAVLYRYDNRKTQAAVSYACIVEGETGVASANHKDYAELSFERFCKLMREIIAWRAA